MIAAAPSLRALVLGDRQAARVVPPSGFTAQLTIFVAAVMAFLAVFALALSVASGRLADRWGQDLARTATVRISAPANQLTAQADAALTVLSSTAGIASARALTDDEQRALLAPWFGTELDLDALPLPRLIEITATEEGFDAAGLRLRLAAEVPGAVLDDHTRWREPLIAAAGRLRGLAVATTLLIFAAVAAIVTLAANAALAANAQVIAVLRLVGATDRYIAQAFIRRFTLRTLAGAAAGALVGLFALWLLPADSGELPGLLSDLGFRGAQWLLPFVVPPLAALVAFFATGWAARRALQDLQ